MRYALVVAGLVAVVAVGVVVKPWGTSDKAPPAAAKVHIPPALDRQLRDVLKRTPPRVSSVERDQPGPRVCYVAADRCSETPCVEFAQAGAPTQTSSVVLRVGPELSGRTCQGRSGAPSIVRATGP